MRPLITILLACLLTACGGGDPEPTCVVDGRELPAEVCR